MAEQEEIGKPEPEPAAEPEPVTEPEPEPEAEPEPVTEPEPEPEAEPKESRPVIQRFPPDVLMSTNKPVPKG